MRVRAQSFFGAQRLLASCATSASAIAPASLRFRRARSNSVLRFLEDGYSISTARALSSVR
jgi:hypothetical protein